MKEALDEAIKEIKRVDHLFYVSLKYTRTVDMMKHMLERLISTYSFGVHALLKQLKEEEKIDEIPNNEGLRIKLLLDTFPDEELRGYINLYLRLRKLVRASYTKREEFRRHVTMTATIDNGEVVEVNIDSLKEDYEKTKSFIHFTRHIVYGEEEL